MLLGQFFFSLSTSLMLQTLFMLPRTSEGNGQSGYTLSFGVSLGLLTSTNASDQSLPGKATRPNPVPYYDRLKWWDVAQRPSRIVSGCTAVIHYSWQHCNLIHFQKQKYSKLSQLFKICTKMMGGTISNFLAFFVVVWPIHFSQTALQEAP